MERGESERVRLGERGRARPNRCPLAQKQCSLSSTSRRNLTLDISNAFSRACSILSRDSHSALDSVTRYSLPQKFKSTRLHSVNLMTIDRQSDNKSSRLFRLKKDRNRQRYRKHLRTHGKPNKITRIFTRTRIG